MFSIDRPLGPSLSVFVPGTFRFLCSLTCKSLFIFFKRIFGVFLLHDSFSSTVLVLLFNFQGPRPLAGQLVYYITSPPPCQYLFPFFLPVFSLSAILYKINFKFSTLHKQKLHLNTLPGIIHCQKHFLQQAFRDNEHATVHTYIQLLILFPWDSV